MTKKTWQTSEIRRLTAAIRGAQSPREIILPGRSPAAVRHMASKLGLVGDGIRRRPWNEGQKSQLRALILAGYTASRIVAEGALPGFNRNAVQKQMQRMNLGDAQRRAAQKRAARLWGAALDRFHAFLRANARGCTPGQLALLWNEEHSPKVSHARVLYHLEQLGLKLPRNVVIRMAFSREKQRTRARAFVARELERRRRLREEEPHRLKLLASERFTQTRATGKEMAIRTCAECRCTWPAEAPFFHISVKQTPDDARGYPSRTCRLCRNRKRREKMAAEGSLMVAAGELAAVGGM